MSAIDFKQLYARLDRAEEVLARDGAESLEVRQRILDLRARSLAEGREQKEQDGILDLLVFSVGGESYAVRTSDVEHVLPLKAVFPVPNIPKTFLGTMSVQSKVLAVLDLRQILDLAGAGMSDLTVAIVVSREDPFVLAVQFVEGRSEVSRGDLERPISGPFLHIAKGRWPVLDLQQIARPQSTI